jgi:hypothetical protein
MTPHEIDTSVTERLAGLQEKRQERSQQGGTERLRALRERRSHAATSTPSGTSSSGNKTRRCEIGGRSTHLHTMTADAAEIVNATRTSTCGRTKPNARATIARPTETPVMPTIATASVACVGTRNQSVRHAPSESAAHTTAALKRPRSNGVNDVERSHAASRAERSRLACEDHKIRPFD